jgi:hydroxymethylpyrimidine kinase/phosphomethylpyrimidine kinase
MLPTFEIVSEVARLFRESDLPAPVIDPVLRSTSGFELMAEDAIQPLLTDLMPQGRVVTPNIPEAERFTGMSITSESDMREAARKMRKIGARAVLVKGGHLGRRAGDRSQGTGEPTGTAQAIDVLDDDGRVTVFRGEWIEAPPVRGTGCMLSAAIAACLSREMSLEESVERAKAFVSQQIRSALMPNH